MKTPMSWLAGISTTYHSKPCLIIVSCCFYRPVAIEPLIKRVWRQILASVLGTLPMSASPETPAANSLSSPKIPQEVINIIIAYLVYDISSLWVCSLISRSLYISAVPRLHHTITVQTYDHTNKKTEWPKPLLMASRFGFLPFVTTVVIYGHSGYEFAANRFDGWTRREFYKLTSVRQLYISSLITPASSRGSENILGSSLRRSDRLP